MTFRESDVCGTIEQSSARDALVALRNTEHLVRSPKVGQKVVMDLLPELLSGLVALEAFFSDFARSCPESPTSELSFVSLREMREAIVAAQTSKGVSARLALERALARLVPVLEACVEVSDLWARAGLGQTTELTVRDVVASVLEPTKGMNGYVVSVSTEPLPFVCDPTVAVWLLRAILAGVEQGMALVALAGEAGPEITVRQTTPVGTRMVLRSPSPELVLGALEPLARRAGCTYEGTPFRRLVLPRPRGSVRAPVSDSVRPRDI